MCGESGSNMWRVKEETKNTKDTKEETHEALRGATGSGNVAIGPNTGSVTNIGNNSAAATTVNLGNTGTSAFGAVNVGRGAATVNIGGNVASAITLGSSTGSVTLGPALTLGAAPTTSAHLGYNIGVTSTPVSGAISAGGSISISMNLSAFPLPIGIYSAVFFYNLSPGVGNTFCKLTANNPTGVTYISHIGELWTSNAAVTNDIKMSLPIIFRVDVAGTATMPFTFNITSTGAGNLNACLLYTVRIA